MKKISGLRVALTVVFAVTVSCFFGIVYPHHLHYQEQNQLFLYDMDYALEVVSVPGGFADYVGRFFTQFFIYSWLGAVFIALLLSAVQMAVSRGQRVAWLYALGFVPAIFLWRLLLDENALLGAVVAILLCVLAGKGVRILQRGLVLNVMAVLGLPLLYWLAGPVALWLYTGLVILALVTQSRKSAAVVAPVLFILALALPTIARRLVAVDLDRLAYGVHYFRYSVHESWPLWSAVASILAIRAAGWAGRRWPLGRLSLLPATLICWAVVGTPLILLGVNHASEEVMAYDFMARTQQWNRILFAGDAKEPNNPTSATVHNLALGMKGRLADHMFEYPQQGTSGLLPKFVRDPFSPLATSEVFYQLGMINTAQQFVFEAQEAIPDYQKSGRCYKRLAETNLINGAYDVARKYLLALQKTWFYRSWATATLSLLGNEEAIARHPEYGRLRRQNIQASFFFSDHELPQMLGQLLLCNRQNRLAFEYLEATYLLLGDLDSFARCYYLGKELGYPVIPDVFLQGLLLYWSRDHAASERMPAEFRQDMVNSMHQFYADVQGKHLTSEQMRARWGKTYWYYYFYEK